jgi:hypothetical protein
VPKFERQVGVGGIDTYRGYEAGLTIRFEAKEPALTDGDERNVIDMIDGLAKQMQMLNISVLEVLA